MKVISAFSRNTLRNRRNAFAGKHPYVLYYLDMIIYGGLLYVVFSTTASSTVPPWSLEALLSALLIGAIISGVRMIEFFRSKAGN